jgi:hypothetical protein
MISGAMHSKTTPAADGCGAARSAQGKAADGKVVELIE